MTRRVPRRLVLWFAAVSLAGLGTGVPTEANQVPNPVVQSTAPLLHVKGTQLLDQANRRVVLHGVNRSGPEFACHPPSGVGGSVFEGPSDDASIAAIASWKGINAVRVPLNEDCWLGLRGADPVASGIVYQTLIQDYVERLHQHGLVAILDLHWTGGIDHGPGVQCSAITSQCQKSMPDAEHAPEFWRSVATVFKDDQSTIFDLFNEPFPDLARGYAPARAWTCWKLGGSACPGYSFKVAGMQSLVDAVRSTGARNVVMVGGLSFSLDLSGFATNRPRDPIGNLAASWHVYNFNGCPNAACWSRKVSSAAKVVPLIVGEIGQDDCKHAFIEPLMTWLDARKLSYLAWAWNTYAPCSSHPILISDYDGTPTGFGQGYKSHLAKLRS